MDNKPEENKNLTPTPAEASAETPPETPTPEPTHESAPAPVSTEPEPVKTPTEPVPTSEPAEAPVETPTPAPETPASEPAPEEPTPEPAPEPAAPEEPKTIVEQAEAETAAVSSNTGPMKFGENVKKKSPALIVLLVLLVLLLGAGLVLFVFFPDTLNSLLSSNPTPVAETTEPVEKQKSEEPTESKTETEEKTETAEAEEPQKEVSTTDYLNIIDWKIKVQIPSVFNSIELTSNEEYDYFYDFYVNDEYVGVIVSKVPETAGAFPDTTIANYTINDTDYIIATWDTPKTTSAKKNQETLVNYIVENRDKIKLISELQDNL